MDQKSITQNIDTKPDVAKYSLRMEEDFFKYFSLGQAISKCNSSYKCFKCGGSYNISMSETNLSKCNKKDDDNDQATEETSNICFSGLIKIVVKIFEYFLIVNIIELY